MLLPLGKVIHGNLSTTFTNFSDLISDLLEERISGYLHLNSWEYDGYLLLDSGHLVQAYEFKHTVFSSGQEVINTIEKKVIDKDGVISVHQIQQETVFVLIALAEREEYLKKTSSTEKSISEIDDELQEKELTCVLNICFGDNFGEASVYIHDGIPVDCVIKSNSGKMLSGVQLYEKIIDTSMKYSSSYEIIKGDYIKAVEAVQRQGQD